MGLVVYCKFVVIEIDFELFMMIGPLLALVTKFSYICTCSLKSPTCNQNIAFRMHMIVHLCFPMISSNDVDNCNFRGWDHTTQK